MRLYPVFFTALFPIVIGINATSLSTEPSSAPSSERSLSTALSINTSLLTEAPAVLSDRKWSCATEDPDPNDMEKSAKLVDTWIAGNNNLSRRQVPNISIHWHMIQGKKKKGLLSDRIIDKSIDVLNDAFAPYFTFSLESIEAISSKISKKWWPLDMDHDGEMKEELRVGDCSVLNIYTSEVIKNGPLGWATFPYNCDDKSYRDGVVIDYRVAPEGWLYPYNEGDVLVHEIGHWLGLYHTFHKGKSIDGCAGDGDYVDDTPAVKTPNFDCRPIDSCPYDGLGKDHTKNFMDYTDDLCRREFTSGQFTRMAAHWDEYRSELTSEPTLEPTLAPTPDFLCDHNEQVLTIVLKPDKNKRQNKFLVKYRKHNKKRGWKTLMKVGAAGIIKNWENEYYECINAQKFCYRITIHDKQGNGICCEHGDGFYAIYIDGDHIWESEFEDGKQENYEFGRC